VHAHNTAACDALSQAHPTQSVQRTSSPRTTCCAPRSARPRRHARPQTVHQTPWKSTATTIKSTSGSLPLLERISGCWRTHRTDTRTRCYGSTRFYCTASATGLPRVVQRVHRPDLLLPAGKTVPCMCTMRARCWRVASVGPAQVAAGMMASCRAPAFSERMHSDASGIAVHSLLPSPVSLLASLPPRIRPRSSVASALLPACCPLWMWTTC